MHIKVNVKRGVCTMAGQGYKLPEKNDEKDGSGSGDSDEEETTQVVFWNKNDNKNA